MLQRGHSGDGCDWRRLCVNMILGRDFDLFVLSWAGGASSEPGKYIFTAANVW